MCDIKISDRRAVHEQNNLLGRAGKEIIAQLASMKRVAAANPGNDLETRLAKSRVLSIGNLPNGTTSLVSRFLAQDAPDRNVIFRCREVSLLHPRSGDNIDPALH